MPKFNSAYFQAQILKNQIAVDVAVADNTRIGADTPASLAVTVDGIIINAPSGNHVTTEATAANQFIISTANSKLYKSTDVGITWAFAENGNYVFDASSNATYANKAWSTVNGVLSSIQSKRFVSKNNVVLYTCAVNGAVTVVSAGRYFNKDSDPDKLFNVAYCVTNGTYTVVPNTPGARQFVDTTTDSYFYYDSENDIWALLPFA